MMKSFVHSIAGMTLCFAALPMLAACQETDATGTVDPVGVYRLIEIDGKKIPTAVSHGGELYIPSGTFTITREMTCTSVIHLRFPSGEEAAKEVKAAYTQKGNTLTMKWEGAGITEGTVEGDTFTMINEGMTFTYKRQPEESEP